MKLEQSTPVDIVKVSKFQSPNEGRSVKWPKSDEYDNNNDENSPKNVSNVTN